jgi:A/G-specific adenine glycosylase
MLLEQEEKDQFAHILLNWYATNQRELPWRNIKDPYPIWLSEIILQQTRVKQGLPYYQRFVEAYPSVIDLACAPEQEVMRLWQGLGYYSRARNMHNTAKYIADVLHGTFPDNYQDLLKLKGVGTYTASAIASFAFEEAVAVLDGNVFRVLARYFGIEEDINSGKGAREFSTLAQSLLPKSQSSTYNQAIMEFGALQCKPQSPECGVCPLSSGCRAFARDLQSQLPVKSTKIKVKERFFHYIILENDGCIAMKKRTQQDIWQNLFDFCLIEAPTNHYKWDEVLDSARLHDFFTNFALKKQSQIFKHVLTHQIIYAQFWHIILNLDEVIALPKPILIDNYLKRNFF